MAFISKTTKIFVHFFDSALNCYICGQSGIFDPNSDCPTQFEYDCNSYGRRFALDSRIFCRTSRHKTIDNTYSVTKECISEIEHIGMFPENSAVLSGCDLLSGSDFEIVYCVCSTDLCNFGSIRQQLVMSSKSNIGWQVKKGHQNGKTTFEEQQLRRRQVENSLRKIETSNQQNEDVLMCMTCSEGNLSNGMLDCTNKFVINCSAQYPTGTETRCFTRRKITAPGVHSMEKLCVSVQAVIEEFGPSAALNGCVSLNHDHLQYCVCHDDYCNDPSIQQQILNSSFWKLPPTVENVSLTILHCFVCGESELNETQDCEQNFEHPCRLQYEKENNAQLYCMTRRTKLVSGRYSVEKRCISKSEHNLHYPKDQTVPLNENCGSAFQGRVHYCLCSKNLCNKGNLPKTTIIHFDENLENATFAIETATSTLRGQIGHSWSKISSTVVSLSSSSRDQDRTSKQLKKIGPFNHRTDWTSNYRQNATSFCTSFSCISPFAIVGTIVHLFFRW